MRRIGVIGAFAAILLLARCGVVERRSLPTALPCLEAAIVPAPTVAPSAVIVPQPAEPPVVRQPTQLERVRELVGSLGGEWCGTSYHWTIQRCVPPLRELGTSALEDYRTILADQNSPYGEILGVLYILDELQFDGRQFIPLVVQRLTAPDLMMTDEAAKGGGGRPISRSFLIEFLRFNGDEKCAWVVVPYLSSDDDPSAEGAAKALAKIGGRRELEAFNNWLIEQNPNDPRLPHFRRYRDQLESRLSAQPTRKPF